MEKIRFITVTSVYNNNRTSVILNVNGINAIREGDDGYTNIKHIGHNNGGYDVMESEEEILELIKQSQFI
jgi:hypothetical protein